MKLDRIIRTLLASALVLCLLAAVGCTTGEPSGSASSQQSAAVDASSEDVSAEDASSEGASSEGVSSQEGAVSSEVASSEEELALRDSRGWVIVRNMLDSLGLSFGGDTSACFPEGAAGYVVEGGPYKIDAATLKRLTTANVEGSGSVRWINYKENGFDGDIPVSKLHDPVFMSMYTPGDVRTYYLNPGNGGILSKIRSRHTNLLSIGAIYRNEDNPPPDDMQITLCFRDIRLLLHTQEKGWFIADEQRVPSDGMVNSIYFLPWGHKPPKYDLNGNKVNQFDDHTEVSLTGADLNGKKSSDTDAAVLHFWGRMRTFEELGVTWDQIDGVLVSYYVWVKEPEAVGHLTATIGADLREVIGGATDQVFTGHNYLVTTQPTNVIGHNVVPSIYYKVMDSELVQKLIGLK